MAGPYMNDVERRSHRRPARQYVSETHDHKPDAPTRDTTPVVYSAANPHPDSILGRIVARDRANHERVREEIKAKGTWWAATEILELRQRIAALARTGGA